jgi:uncharacterized RDD family membrane protein YckC
MNYDYYILEDGEQKGPYTFEELTDKGLNIHSRVLSPLADTWQDACDLPEFYRYFEAKGIYFPTEDNLASFWWRLLAYIIDTIILYFVSQIIFAILAYRGITFDVRSYGELLKMPVIKLLELQLISSLTLIIYNSVCEASSMKGSIGKRICRIVVVDIDGVGLTYPVALVRSIGKVLSISMFYVGFLSIFWSEHRQALHDYLAKTYVVKRD